ncbi:tetrapyrrole methylase [Lentinula lateritia]|nr:tetrapyrrole methylase [Lentinula lateritia]
MRMDRDYQGLQYQKGSLIIAGSGIASIRHITLETLSYIENADKVYYIVTDPATEAFTQEKSKGNFADLTIYSDKDKSRFESYVMLHDVRAGIQVVGVFYGHPGVFEATSIVIHNKVLYPTIHNIIWQVGSVGVATMVFDNGLFHLLVDHLEKYFGPNDKVIHYIGAVLPQSVTVKDEFTIAELREERIIKQITTVSTFYVPPREKSTSCTKSSGAIVAPSPTVSRIANHDTPVDHVELQASAAPDLQDRYKKDPVVVTNTIPELTAEESFAPGLGKPGPVSVIMRATKSDITAGNFPTCETKCMSLQSSPSPLP